MYDLKIDTYFFFQLKGDLTPNLLFITLLHTSDLKKNEADRRFFQHIVPLQLSQVEALPFKYVSPPECESNLLNVTS